MVGGGVLSINSFKQDEEIIIEISDTGIGISEENIEKAFQPLFTTKINGFGLGLSITKKYVTANKGTITFTSKEGKETTFIISLPIY